MLPHFSFLLWKEVHITFCDPYLLVDVYTVYCLFYFIFFKGEGGTDKTLTNLEPKVCRHPCPCFGPRPHLLKFDFPLLRNVILVYGQCPYHPSPLEESCTRLDGTKAVIPIRGVQWLHLGDNHKVFTPAPWPHTHKIRSGVELSDSINFK